MMDFDEQVKLITESKRYSGICDQTVRRVLSEELKHHKKPADSVKAAKARLHQATGMFFSAGEKALESALENGNPLEAAALHISGRERMDYWDEFYSPNGIDIYGKSVLDIACGLNPLILLEHGAGSVLGTDIYAPMGAFIERFAERRGWSFQFMLQDAVSSREYPKADITLALKLLPILERERAGSAAALLECVNSPHIAVSFPTKSMSGKGKGMRETYSEWFKRILPQGFTIEKEIVIGSELLFIILKNTVL